MFDSIFFYSRSCAQHTIATTTKITFGPCQAMTETGQPNPVTDTYVPERIMPINDLIFGN